LIPWKLLQMCGILVIPLVRELLVRPARAFWGRWPLLSWAAAAYLLVLAVFVTHNLFVTARYVSMLNWLLVPVVAAGLFALTERLGHWKWLAYALVALTMLINVVKLSGDKEQIRVAGAWLSEQGVDRTRIFIDDPRIAYYAGWSYWYPAPLANDLTGLAQAIGEGRLDMLALSYPAGDPVFADWLSSHHFRVVQQFPGTGRNRDTIAIVVPEEKS
jgi:hypothetical protein